MWSTGGVFFVSLTQTFKTTNSKGQLAVTGRSIPQTTVWRSSGVVRDRAVRALLEAGADPDVKHALGPTALLLAAERGHLRVIRTLLVRGADPSIGLADGRALSDFAKEHPRLLEELNRRAGGRALPTPASRAR